MHCVCVLSCFSCVRLFANLWAVACQVPLSMGFSRQEYWSGMPCPPPGDLVNPGIKPTSLMSPALAGGLFTTGATWEAPVMNCTNPYCAASRRGVITSCNYKLELGLGKETRIPDGSLSTCYILVGRQLCNGEA